MISHALKYTNACNNNMYTQYHRYDHTFVGGRGGGQRKGGRGMGHGAHGTADYFARPTKIGLLQACTVRAKIAVKIFAQTSPLIHIVLPHTLHTHTNFILQSSPLVWRQA